LEKKEWERWREGGRWTSGEVVVFDSDEVSPEP
jgi:hypothetical protein